MSLLSPLLPQVFTCPHSLDGCVAVILAGSWAGQGDRRQLEAKNSLSGTQDTVLLCCRSYRTSRLPGAGERIKRRGKVFLPLCCRSGAMINKLQSPAALPFLQGGRGRVEGAGVLGTQQRSKLVPHILCPEPSPPARIPISSHAPLFSHVTLHFPPNILFKAPRKTQGVLLQCLHFLPFIFPTATLKNPFYSHELKVLSIMSNYAEIAS